MSRSANLMRLQNIDSQIQHIQDRIDEIQKALYDTSELKDSEKLVVDADTYLHNCQEILRKNENNVRDQRIKIEQTDNSLYGGKIRNPKELQDLQNEAAALRRYLSVLEDRQLDSMISLEEAETRYQMAKDNYEKIKTKKVQQSEKLSGEMSQLNMDLKRLDVERNVVTQTIDVNDLEIYEKLRNSRRGLAVTTIVDHTCVACGTTLTPAIRQSAQSPTLIVQCPSCRRILYLG